MASYYASADERARLIAGFRALADFLQDHPDVPAPYWADVMVFPSRLRRRRDARRNRPDRRAHRNRTRRPHGRSAAITQHRGNFGPVEYRAVAICAYARPDQHASDEKGV